MQRRPRVLQFIDGLNIGGAEVLLRDLVRHLRDNGYFVGVGYSTPGPMLEQFQALQIPVTCLPRRSRFDPALFLGMLRLIRHERPDIVHTHLLKSDLFGRLAARLCRIPVVISTSHNNDVWAKQQPLGWIYGLSNRLADRVIAVSDEVRIYQMKYTGTSGEKIMTIDNGVDVSRFVGQEQAGQAVRSELGIPSSTFLLGIIGRLSPQKDHETFLQAAKVIVTELPETRFLIVGDGPLRGALEAQAAVLGLAEAVIFCGVRKDIPAIMSAINLLVFSSRWEGLPITLLEGMAAGKAVIATNVGGVSGVVEEGKTALLVPPGNPVALAQACLRMIYSPETAQKMGAAGLARVRQKYSLELMLQRTTTLYEELWQSHVKTARA